MDKSINVNGSDKMKQEKYLQVEHSSKSVFADDLKNLCGNLLLIIYCSPIFIVGIFVIMNLWYQLTVVNINKIYSIIFLS